VTTHVIVDGHETRFKKHISTHDFLYAGTNWYCSLVDYPKSPGLDISLCSFRDDSVDNWYCFESVDGSIFEEM
jgi:hypothetical protein